MRRVGAMVLAAVLAGAVLGGQAASAGERQEQEGTRADAGGSLFAYDSSGGGASLMGLDSRDRVGLRTTATTSYTRGYSQVASGEFLSSGRGSGIVMHDPSDGRWVVLESRGPGSRPTPLANGRFAVGYDRIQVVEADGGWFLLLVRWGDDRTEPSWSLLSLDPRTGVPRFASTGWSIPDLVGVEPIGDGDVLLLQRDDFMPGSAWARWSIEGTGTSARVVDTPANGRLNGEYFGMQAVETDGDTATREFLLEAPYVDGPHWSVVRIEGNRLRPVGTGTLARNVLPWWGLDVLGRPDDGVTPLVSWVDDQSQGRGLRWSGPGTLAPTVVSRAAHAVDAAVWVVHPTA